MPQRKFNFKQFSIADDQCAMKVGTDGVLLGAWCDIYGARSILDIGSGSGIIALMMAQRNKTATITAVEIDAASASQANENILSSPWSRRVTVVNSAIQDMVVSNSKSFDHIVSNPPFYPVSRFMNAVDESRQIARSDKCLSLKDLFGSASHLLVDDGSMHIIIPVGLKNEAIDLANEAGLYPAKITQVFPGTDKKCHRALIMFTRAQSSIQEDQLIIQKSKKRNDFTDEYILLTREFHTML